MKSLVYMTMFFILSCNTRAQDTYAEYRFKLFDSYNKKLITPQDTTYKIEINRTEKNKKQTIYYFDYNSSPEKYWVVVNSSESHQVNFTDYVRLKIFHGSEVMTVTLMYNANIWTLTIIDGTVINDFETQTDRIMTDTLIFIPGDFCLKTRKDYNYWKNEASIPKTKSYRFMTYKYIGGGRDECINDTLRQYVNGINKTKINCLLVDHNGVVRARGKKKSTIQESTWQSFEPYGIWTFYDEKGKQISRKAVAGKF